jgi:hypothetical protein
MRSAPIQIVIDGQHFGAIAYAFAAARDRGFAGAKTTFATRLKHGATTWAELLAPMKEDGGRVATCAAHRAEEKALMAQLCAELDARKAALKEAA